MGISLSVHSSRVREGRLVFLFSKSPRRDGCSPFRALMLLVCHVLALPCLTYEVCDAKSRLCMRKDQTRNPDRNLGFLDFRLRPCRLLQTSCPRRPNGSKCRLGRSSPALIWVESVKAGANCRAPRPRPSPVSFSCSRPAMHHAALYLDAAFPMFTTCSLLSWTSL